MKNTNVLIYLYYISVLNFYKIRVSEARTQHLQPEKVSIVGENLTDHVEWSILLSLRYIQYIDFLLSLRLKSSEHQIDVSYHIALKLYCTYNA